MTEADIQRTCIDYLWRIGWLVIRINQGATTQTDSQTGQTRYVKFATWYALGLDPANAGINDILAFEPGLPWGRLWVIECKAPGKLNKLTEGQQAFQAEAVKRGAVVITIDSPDMLIEAVEKERLPVMAT